MEVNLDSDCEATVTKYKFLSTFHKVTSMRRFTKGTVTPMYQAFCVGLHVKTSKMITPVYKYIFIFEPSSLLTWIQYTCIRSISK